MEGRGSFIVALLKFHTHNALSTPAPLSLQQRRRFLPQTVAKPPQARGGIDTVPIRGGDLQRFASASVWGAALQTPRGADAAWGEGPWPWQRSSARPCPSRCGSGLALGGGSARSVVPGSPQAAGGAAGGPAASEEQHTKGTRRLRFIGQKRAWPSMLQCVSLSVGNALW